ncbi:MAG: formate dehydrogenase accessory sulfurtransferase FdhD [Sphingomonadales bacterium]|nr:formate dehydrogenase accessory sulfurtransferase FdhD [Sphingomonadales bacterium]
MNNKQQHIRIQRFENSTLDDNDDAVSVEEPLEIQVEFGPAADRKVQSLSITMRTPGNDDELAIGFLFTEGIIHKKKDVLSAKHVQTLPGMSSNYIQVSLNPELNFNPAQLQRNFYTTSSCGVCGKSSLDSVKTQMPGKSGKMLPTLSPELIISFPKILREQQETFETTGGLHASGLFDTAGNLLYLREDVGRHNALDKLIGRALMDGKTPLDEYILLLSGRASFELMQKAGMAGISLICAVGAPSSLAVECAKEFGITLIGFLRENRFNIYSGSL